MANNKSESVLFKDLRLDLSINEAREFVNQGKLKEAITFLAAFINNEESLDSFQRDKLVNWSLDYKRKRNLSKEDVEQFIERIKKFF